MELVRTKIWGFKRFRDESTLNTDGKIVALVGPNEAGKTTLLNALVHLNSDYEFADDEFTRGGDRSKIGVLATYELDDADREAIKGLPGWREARLFTLFKRPDGSRHWTIDPAIKRDRRPRERIVSRMRRLLKSKWMSGDDEDARQVRELITQVAGYLEEDEERLAGHALGEMDRLASELVEYEALPRAHATLTDDLAELTAAEREHPYDTAIRTLENRRPDFLFFGDDARLLRPAYPLVEGSHAALDNLLNLAGVSWTELTEAAAAEEHGGRLEALTKKANEKLEEEFGRAWSQKRHTPLTVRLRIDGGVLRILIPLHETDYLPVSQRSDGLQQFVALRAFVATTGALDPVLLIDEAERHLHYDAQADLIDVLTEQTDAPKVIYSTHSAGCLPKDLGTGVRAVIPVEGSDHSKVENWFWARGPGYSSLLIGMGASVLAFSSARKAVIAEGVSDAILLPTLIREVTGEPVLDYQVAPGLSNVTKQALADLDLTAARVAYLVDGDQGGRDLRQDLLDHDVPEERITVLGAGSATDLTLEDLIAEAAFIDAVNGELAKVGSDRIAAADLSVPRRWRSLEAWCGTRSIEPPSKRAVAQRLIDGRRGRSLVAKEHRATVRTLHRELMKKLAKPAKATGRS